LFGVRSLTAIIKDSFIRNDQLKIPLVVAAIILLPLQALGLVEWETHTKESIAWFLLLVNRPINPKVKMNVSPKSNSYHYILPDRCRKRRIWKYPRVATTLESIAFPHGIAIDSNLCNNDVASATESLNSLPMFLLMQLLYVIFLIKSTLTTNASVPTPTPTTESTLLPTDMKPKLVSTRNRPPRRYSSTNALEQRIRSLTISLRRITNFSSLKQRHQRWFMADIKSRVHRP